MEAEHIALTSHTEPSKECLTVVSTADSLSPYSSGVTRLSDAAASYASRSPEHEFAALRTTLSVAKADVTRLSAALLCRRADAEHAVAVSRADAERQAALHANRILELEARLAAATCPSATSSPHDSPSGSSPPVKQPTVAKGAAWKASEAGDISTLLSLLRVKGKRSTYEADEVCFHCGILTLH